MLGLVFSLKTHRDIFNPEYEDEDGWGWSVRTSVIALAIAGVSVGVMSEVLVGSISEASKSVGLSEFFIGVIVVAIVGNAAEHWVAVLVARKGKMDLAVNIAIGSSAQVALFVAPVLVFASFFLGPHPLALVFNGFELGAILLAVLIANYVTQEGESTWFEGVQLLAVYLVFGIAFYSPEPCPRLRAMDPSCCSSASPSSSPARCSSPTRSSGSATGSASAKGRSAASSPRSARRCRRR